MRGVADVAPYGFAKILSNMRYPLQNNIRGAGRVGGP